MKNMQVSDATHSIACRVRGLYTYAWGEKVSLGQSLFLSSAIGEYHILSQMGDDLGDETLEQFISRRLLLFEGYMSQDEIDKWIGILDRLETQSKKMKKGQKAVDKQIMKPRRK